MDERRRLHAAKAAQYMRGVQHRASRFAVTVAVAEEQKQEAAVETQRGTVDETLAKWSAYLLSSALDPDGIKRFADHAGLEERSLGTAQAELDEATRQRQSANQTEGEAQVRAQQATTLVRTLRKKARRKREERALQALEDKTSYESGSEP